VDLFSFLQQLNEFLLMDVNIPNMATINSQQLNKYFCEQEEKP